MQFLTGASKIEVFETCFYDIVTTQYDLVCKAVLGRAGYFGGGGGGHTTCGQLKNRSF